MIPPLNRIRPNEGGRKWHTITGTVHSQKIYDKRNFLTKWLSSKFPDVSLFQNFQYVVSIELDPYEYLYAGSNLNVVWGWCPSVEKKIPKKINLEIDKEDFVSKYHIGSLVKVSIGISSFHDQYFTGTTAVKYILEKIE